jgi:ATP-binding cassette subfamily B protein
MRPDFGHFEEENLGRSHDLRLMRRLAPLLRPQGRLLAASIALVVLITLVDLALPLVTRTAIDRYIVPRPSHIQHKAEDLPSGRHRSLAFSMDDPAIRSLVARYPDAFSVAAGQARIRPGGLSLLSPADAETLQRPRIDGLARITLLFLGLIAAGFALNFLQKVIMEYAGHMIMHDLRMRIFRHIENLSVSFFNRQPVGRLTTRVTNDVQNMHELFTSFISMILKDILLLTGIAGVLAFLNLKLAFITFAALPLVIYAAAVFSGRVREVFRTLRLKIAEINTRFAETIGGIRVIQLFAQEGANYRRFAALNREVYEAGMRQIHVLGLFMPFIEFLGTLMVAVLIYYGGLAVLSQALTLGSLVAFLSYIRMFFRPIRDLADKYNLLQNALASAERIFLILDSDDYDGGIPPARGAGAADLETIESVAFEKISFGYNPEEPVLRDITFGVHRGQTVALVGSTGSGKTTLVHLLARFYDAHSGRILINGRDIRSIAPGALRARIALVSQDPFLFSGTVRDNILAGNPDLSEKALARVLEDANCTGLIKRLPRGLETSLSREGAGLSSGERQLISIARALARDPDLIILDEATSYVDSHTESMVQKAMASLTVRRTAFVVAHRLSTARHADLIMVLHHGRLIEAGTHRELLNRRGIYFNMVRMENFAGTGEAA